MRQTTIDGFNWWNDSKNFNCLKQKRFDLFKNKHKKVLAESKVEKNAKNIP